MNTVWFLILVAMFPDHDHLVDQWPQQFPTQRECANYGATLVVEDRDERRVKLYCVESDDAYDLRLIINQAFNFGGRVA